MVICTGTGNGHLQTDASARLGVTVMHRPWPLATANGFILVLAIIALVSGYLPGFMFYPSSISIDTEPYLVGTKVVDLEFRSLVRVHK
jgi:hypothetical protein